MNQQGNTPDVRKVRTFADDMRQAQAGKGKTSANVVPPKPATPQPAPASVQQPQPSPNTVAPPAPVQTPPPSVSASAQPVKQPPQRAAENSPPPSPPQQPKTPPVISSKGVELGVQMQPGGAPEASIVTDTKRKRWSFAKEVKRSLVDWAGDQKENLEDVAKARKAPRPNVAPSSTRTDVIEKAEAKSHIAPRDDHHTVVERLRTFAQDAERATGKPYNVKGPKKEERPQWSNPDEAVKKTAQDAESEPPQTSPQEVPNYRRADVVPKEVAGAVAPEAVQSTPDHEFLKQSSGERREVKELHGQPDVAPTAKRRTPVPADVADKTRAGERLSNIVKRKQEEEAPAAPSRDIEFNIPTFDKKASEKFRTLRYDAIDDIEDRKLSVPRIAAAEAKRRAREDTGTTKRKLPYVPIAIGVVAVLVISGAAAGGYFWFMRGDGTGVQVGNSVRVPSFVGSVEQTAIPFTGNRETLVDAMRGAKDSATGPSRSIVQFYPSIQTGFGATPVTTDVFMSVFNPRAPGSFIRSLEDDMMFGVYLGTNRDPFFIFKTSRFDTAFAGMLAWESTMGEDLGPVFNTREQRTRFVDEVIRNRDVRVLYDSDGDEHILYSFIDPETIIITTSAEAFLTLLERS